MTRLPLCALPGIAIACLLSAPLCAQWVFLGASPAGNVVGAVYDEARAVTVAVVVAPGGSLQTWEWNGSTWTQNASAGSPGFDNDHGGVLVYDPFDRRVLSIVGEGPLSSGGWIYQYRGLSWQGIAPAPGQPPGALVIAAALDTARRVVVAQVYDQTWEWNGAAWSLRATTAAPGRLDYSRMVFDPLLQRALLVGGQTTTYVLGWGYVLNNTTWSWDGVQWTAMPAAFDSARVMHSLTYDALRGQALVFGGASSGGGSPYISFYTDSRTLGPAGWSTPVNVPTTDAVGMLNAHLATDLARGRVVLVGTQTWEFVRAGAPTFARFGTGCGGSGSAPQLDLDGGLMPWLGQNLQLRLSALGSAGFAALALGFSNSSWNGVPLPAALPGAPGCSALVSVDLTAFAAPTGGEATFAFAVPNAVNLIGLLCFGQGVRSDPANALGLVVSNGVAIQVGVP